MERNFAQTLSDLRKSRGYSQRKVARDLGISQALLSHYENGFREPGIEFICRVCDYYNISADYLLCRTENSVANDSVINASTAFLTEMKTLVNKAEDALIEFKNKK
jgi:transcriptional regulator with XRE-family HTH domain